MSGPDDVIHPTEMALVIPLFASQCVAEHCLARKSPRTLVDRIYDFE